MTDTQTTIPTAEQIERKCADAYVETVAEARRRIRGGTYRSRGYWVRVLGTNGDSLLDNGECEFKGTQAQLDALVAKYAGRDDVEALYVEGGADWAECRQAMEDGDYEPWAAEWAVTIWGRA